MVWIDGQYFVVTKGCQCAHLAGASRTHHYDAEFAHGCVGGFSDSKKHICAIYFGPLGITESELERSLERLFRSAKPIPVLMG